jgi:hypothetical protein
LDDPIPEGEQSHVIIFILIDVCPDLSLFQAILADFRDHYPLILSAEITVHFGKNNRRMTNLQPCRMMVFYAFPLAGTTPFDGDLQSNIFLPQVRSGWAA